MPNSAPRLLLAAALALTLGCPGSTGQGRSGRGGPRGQRPGGRTPELVAVAVEASRLQPVVETLVGHAALEPEALVDVTAQAEGGVFELLAQPGDAVERGQILARIDPTRADLRLRETQLALAQAKTSQARAESLAQRGLASAEELEQAREAVAQAKLAVERAELDLDDTAIRSPLAGVVTERLVELGTRLRLGDLAFRVADREPLLARVRIPEIQAERLALGQEAEVRVEGRAEPLRGEVLRVAPLVELGSGTVIATVAVSQDTAGLRLNRFASVAIIVARRPQALTIPQAALALRGEEDRILVCEPAAPEAAPPGGRPGGGRPGGPPPAGRPNAGPNAGQPGGQAKGPQGIVRQRRIRTGVRAGERIEVFEGLKPGELVVVAAPDDLREGARVRVVRTDQPQDPPAPAPSGSASPAPSDGDGSRPR